MSSKYASSVFAGADGIAAAARAARAARARAARRGRRGDDAPEGGEETTRWLLTALAVAISLGLVFWLRQAEKPLPVVAIGLVIGGALGNALDRVRYGAVADFFDVHVAGYSWPAFNIADAGITVGVLLLVVDAMMTPRTPGKTKGR